MVASPTLVRAWTAVEVYASALLAAFAALALFAREGSTAVRRRLVASLAGLALLSLHTSARPAVALALAALTLAGARSLDARRLTARVAAVLALGASTLPLALWLPIASRRDGPVDWGDPETPRAMLAHLSAASIRAAYAGRMVSAWRLPDDLARARRLLDERRSSSDQDGWTDALDAECALAEANPTDAVTKARAAVARDRERVEFRLVLARALRAQGKRVIAFKAGKTALGAQAAQSHTASLAGDYAVARSLLSPCARDPRAASLLTLHAVALHAVHLNHQLGLNPARGLVLVGTAAAAGQRVDLVEEDRAGGVVPAGSSSR
jgi:hypothetical protein